MGTKSFNDLLRLIRARIGILKGTASVLERKVKIYKRTAQGCGPDAEQAATDLETTQAEVDDILKAIEGHKDFYVRAKKFWENPDDRVIGHVVWAPPFSVSAAPQGYTKDVCVIKLDKKKFGNNFRGNVIDLGAC
jgi:hypothetical protein